MRTWHEFCPTLCNCMHYVVTSILLRARTGAQQRYQKSESESELVVERVKIQIPDADFLFAKSVS
jgi:hypothetical protein